MPVEPAIAELDRRFSADDAAMTDWDTVRRDLETAEVSWLTTVRADGRPHVTPLISVWDDGAVCFCSGPDEQKVRNLDQNPHVALTTGRNLLNEGLDIVVEGRVAPVTDSDSLRRIAAAYVAKYGETWRFDVVGDHFTHEGGNALVYRIEPTKAFSFAKGAYSQTRFRFDQA